MMNPEPPFLPAIVASETLPVHFVEAIQSDKKTLLKLADTMMAEAFETGNELELQALFVKIELLAKTITAKGRKVLQETIQRQGERGQLTSQGVKMVITNGKAGSDDFSADSRITYLLGEIEKHKAFLRTLPPEGAMFTDTDTGEVYRAFPPTKSGGSAETITCTIL